MKNQEFKVRDKVYDIIVGEEMLEFIEKIKMDSFQECIIQCFQNKESKEEKIEDLNQAIYYCNIAKENIAKENRIIQNNKIIYGYKKDIVFL